MFFTFQNRGSLFQFFGAAHVNEAKWNFSSAVSLPWSVAAPTLSIESRVCGFKRKKKLLRCTLPPKFRRSLSGPQQGSHGRVPASSIGWCCLHKIRVQMLPLSWLFFLPKPNPFVRQPFVEHPKKSIVQEVGCSLNLFSYLAAGLTSSKATSRGKPVLNSCLTRAVSYSSCPWQMKPEIFQTYSSLLMASCLEYLVSCRGSCFTFISLCNVTCALFIIFPQQLLSVARGLCMYLWEACF